jgi:hypothetical protein
MRLLRRRPLIREGSSIPSKENSKCKGPTVGTSSACSRNRNKVSMAGQETEVQPQKIVSENT